MAVLKLCWRLLLLIFWVYIAFSVVSIYLLLQPPPSVAPGDPAPAVSNAIRPNQTLCLWVYGSPSPSPKDADKKGKLLLHRTNLTYSWSDITFETEVSVPVSAIGPLHQDLYAHFFVARNCSRTKPPKDAISVSTALTKPPSTAEETRPKRYLVYDWDTDNETALADKKVLGTFSPSVCCQMLVDFTRYPRQGIPYHVYNGLHLMPTSTSYQPPIIADPFCDLRTSPFPINRTVTELPLRIQFSPLGYGKWVFMQQMTNALSIHESTLGVKGEELDSIRRMFTDTSPTLLAVTMIVSVLHLFFDILAFKSDISFWRTQKSFRGISVRSLVLNVICSTIILLYLRDSQEASILVWGPILFGIALDIWKIKRAAVVRVTASFPFLTVVEKHSESQATRNFDIVAMKYLSYGLYPLVIGYSLKSLIFDKHHGWYSWLISSLAGAVYTFGFIRMMPQLFINYKLKSVAHISWKFFMYKFFNTFIDDLFAFIIHMPTMHRLSVFRDDIAFFVYLYQRWLYPVDVTRTVQDEGEESESMQSRTDSDMKKEQ
eukprot:GILK01010604.1.p1 GENE.GILK01010604.1~~GILK01010604.1.p1  ORF type:complete len:555 (+),score=91.47 GILK01010604.1:32-1666(+)